MSLTVRSPREAQQGCMKLIGADFTHILSINQSNNRSDESATPFCIKLGRKSPGSTNQSTNQTIGISVTKNVSREHIMISYLPYITNQTINQPNNQTIKELINPSNADNCRIFNTNEQSNDQSINQSTDHWYLTVLGKNGCFVDQNFYSINQTINLSTMKWIEKDWVQIQVSDTVLFAVKPKTD